MLDTKMLVKDVGTMLDGPQAVEEGLIDEVGGIARALEKLNELMKKAAGTENCLHGAACVSGDFVLE